MFSNDCSFPSNKPELRIRAYVLCIRNHFTVFVLPELLSYDRVKTEDSGGSERGAQKQLINLFIVLNSYLLIFYFFINHMTLKQLIYLPYGQKQSKLKQTFWKWFFCKIKDIYLRNDAQFPSYCGKSYERNDRRSHLSASCSFIPSRISLHNYRHLIFGSLQLLLMLSLDQAPWRPKRYEPLNAGTF